MHVATDANFHQRHKKGVGDHVHLQFDAELFVSPEKVQAAEDLLLHAKSRPTGKAAKIPAEALAGCTKSHTAADEGNEKTSGEIWDDRGVMALVCRHDEPLLFCNVDTKGESQKYVIALLTQLYSELPPMATVATLYDVGCIVDHSLTIVGLPPPLRVHAKLVSSMTFSPKISLNDSSLRRRQCMPIATNGHVSSFIILA